MSAISPLLARTGRLAALGLALVGAGLGLTACKDYLDIDATALSSTSETFETAAGTRLAIIGTYQMLSGDNSYGTRVSMYYPYDTDELISSSGTVDGGRRSIARYKALSTNTEITNPWNRLYQGVERANICIANIPKSPIYNVGATADTAAMHRMYAEALALRAQFFLELVRNWGDVPAQFTPTTYDQDPLLPNSDRNATLRRLIDDLAIAEKMLPWRSASGYSNTRFTKGAVKALRARIAMQRGGYALGPQSTTFVRQTDYLDYYRIARQECLEIMNHRSEHTLTSSFTELFKSINELRDNGNTELLFSIGMGGSSAQSDSKLGYYNGPRLTSTVYGNGSGAVTVAPPYFYAFDSLDTRRDVTITTYIVSGATAYTSTTAAAMTDGKFRRDWRLPLLPTPAALNYLGYSWPVLRFADVELLFAEADNEINNGPTPAATQALLEVRTRAFGGNATRAAAGLNLSGKDNFFNALVNERYLEFGSEGIRKYDLLRWNLFTSKLADVKAKIATMQASSMVPYGPTQVLVPVPATQYYRATSTGLTYPRSFYRPTGTAPSGTTSVSWGGAITASYVANTRPTGSVYLSVASTGTGLAAEYVASAGKELLPIPQTTIDTDPNLKQNAGY